MIQILQMYEETAKGYVNEVVMKININIVVLNV